MVSQPLFRIIEIGVGITAVGFYSGERDGAEPRIQQCRWERIAGGGDRVGVMG